MKIPLNKPPSPSPSSRSKLFPVSIMQLIMEPNLDPIYKKKFITFFNNNAEILWRKGINKLDLLYNTNWAMNNSGNNHLTTQTSGCTLIEAKALFEKSLK